jgi:plastocyanin
MSRLVLLMVVLLINPVVAAEYEVDQKNMSFSVTTLNVKVGDTVSFKNSDNMAHNIYSLSDAKTFDLGSTPPGAAKKVVFDQPGAVEVECAIHPSMKMKIIVGK